MPWETSKPPRPPSHPVALEPLERGDRAVLDHLGQLYRYDLSESYGLLPNDDGSFNFRELDRFRLAGDPRRRAWLITAAGRTAGFVLTGPADADGHAITAFFVVRALRRTGVGREAAVRVIGLLPGRWVIGFQRYNPGVEAFWSRVATEVAGDRWEIADGPVPENRPPDTFISLTTQGTTRSDGPDSTPSTS
ncbi:GNAT family N-acetyltransferase [Actinoplanes sp. M2I2]|uniref:GNAT family N-acetyltransferase n=1 Tax=Actinoplanes sp. M2I2 TaxID=1734444 RepID=UPI002021592A|nr:GNAT family N-acetyltransferase [Actinoplanes sp. M2I2]